MTKLDRSGRRSLGISAYSMEGLNVALDIGVGVLTRRGKGLASHLASWVSR
jgi:hypothetical protein